MDRLALRNALDHLERRYFLIVPSWDAPAGPEALAAEWESRLLQDFSGRIWGAYGLREGADALLALVGPGPDTHPAPWWRKGPVPCPPPGWKSRWAG